ncbi:MAG: glycine cleavage system protein GcvH [Deltaproteobacteria bacterium]|nr:glycine cleavage system protein GcvH [Deltaproteobacteria bacterium]
MHQPENLKYTREHEWLSMDGLTAYVGLTSYAAEQLGDIVHIDLPQPQDEFAKEESFGTVESVKSVSDAYMPVTAKILLINDKLAENPGMINEDPYGDGWIIQIEIKDPAEVENLMSFEQYQTYLSEEH